MLLGMTGSWPCPDALWYEDADGFYRWDFALDLWNFYTSPSTAPS